MDAVLAPFAELHFLRAQWLWALLALPLLGWWWRRLRLRASAWRNAVDPHLLPHLLDAGAGRRGRLGWLAAACAYALAVLALSGPSWRQVAQPSWQAPAPPPTQQWHGQQRPQPLRPQDMQVGERREERVHHAAPGAAVRARRAARRGNAKPSSATASAAPSGSG